MRLYAVFSIGEKPGNYTHSKGWQARSQETLPKEVQKELCLDRETPYNRTGRGEGRSSEEASPPHSVAVTKGSQMASGKTFP